MQVVSLKSSVDKFIGIFLFLFLIAVLCDRAQAENTGMWEIIKSEPVGSGYFPANDLYRYLINNNVSSDSAVTMVGIAGAESNYVIDTIADRPNGGILMSNGSLSSPEYSVGLFQINLLAHSRALCSVFSVCSWDKQVNWLKNPYNNAKFAIYLSNNGQNLYPWSTYKNGKYVSYVEQFLNH